MKIKFSVSRTIKIIMGIWIHLLICLPVLGAAADSLAAALQARAVHLADAASLNPLVKRAATRQLVLLGESTHGTSEFYRWRGKLSRRLIEEKGFRFVAVEGDWAAIYRLNRYVKDLPGAEPDARLIMKSFDRWPQWMWSNEEMLEFVQWLRQWNLKQVPEKRAGLYGIDVYGDETVLINMLHKIQRVDEDLASEIEALYAPFKRFAGDGRSYAMHLVRGGQSFAAGAQAGLDLLQERLPLLPVGDDKQVLLNLLQSARVIMHAELHYRANVDRTLNSWNARADHFYLTAEKLLTHYSPDAKGIVWAHNTHIGDARATRMHAEGSRNIGQAAREALGADQVLAVGFGTDRGTVVAGRSWGGKREIMEIPAGGAGTLEAALRALDMPQAVILLENVDSAPVLDAFVGHRAIGVIYHPEREFPGNYVPTRLGRRYDAFVYIAETKALEVIE